MLKENAHPHIYTQSMHTQLTYKHHTKALVLACRDRTHNTQSHTHTHD